MKTQPSNQSVKKRKPLKDIDSVTVSLFLKNFAWPFPFLGILGLVAGLFGLAPGGIGGGVGLAFVASIVASMLTMFVSERLGRTAGKLYGGRRPLWTLRQQLSGDVLEVRNKKMRQEFGPALQKVNQILGKDPEFPEALLLKAQILYEGFGNPAGAKPYLKKIIEGKTNKDDKIYRWAVSLYNEVNATSSKG